ncbi:MAG: hypothetical protein AAGE52_13550 [Myxococcota bacterium]
MNAIYRVRNVRVQDDLTRRAKAVASEVAPRSGVPSNAMVPSSYISFTCDVLGKTEPVKLRNNPFRPVLHEVRGSQGAHAA